MGRFKKGPRSHHVQRTPNAFRPLGEHVRVDHRGLHILVAEQLLHRADVVPGLEQMRDKAMTEGVAGRGFRQSSPARTASFTARWSPFSSRWCRDRSGPRRHSGEAL